MKDSPLSDTQSGLVIAVVGGGAARGMLEVMEVRFLTEKSSEGSVCCGGRRAVAAVPDII